MMSKTRQGNIEIEVKDKNTIYIRDKQTDSWMKLDIIGLLRLFGIMETVKSEYHDDLERLKKEYIADVDEICQDFMREDDTAGEHDENNS